MDEDNIRALVKEINPHQLKGKIALIRSALGKLQQEFEAHGMTDQGMSEFDKIEKYLSMLEHAFESLDRAIEDT